MSATGENSLRQSDLLWSALALAAILVVAWLAYRPAFGATFLLDDRVNLDGLARVEDAASALDFVLSGTAGPLGRPLALASFVPQASAWLSDPAVFLRTNVFIHLLNGCLLFLFARQLAQAVGVRGRDVVYVAATATALWLLMPLLASSSLLIVQRMTTLSATFVLAGLNLYLPARSRIESRPVPALAGMSLALCAGTLLATLSKENGILLPVLLLCTEATLLRRPQKLGRRAWNAWSGVFLVAPTALLLLYLATLVPYTDELVARREFTALERLLTEARILWDYLFNAFVARPGSYGPFRDAYPVASDMPVVVVATAALAWLLLIPSAILFRRRYPLAAFAVLWFAGGHLLESTTVPLELYFEHRNYVPVMGPVLALAIAAVRVAPPLRTPARAALPLLALINAGVLFSVASLWGTPAQAAAYWARQQPDSVRAATVLAERRMQVAGPEAGFAVLRRFSAEHPAFAYIRIPELNLACTLNPEGDHSALVKYLDARLPAVSFSFTAGNMLDQLLTTAAATSCSDVSPSTVAGLARSLLANPRYGNSIRYNRFHHSLMARIARISGDTDRTLQHLARAVEYESTDDLNMMTVTTLVGANRYDAARGFIERGFESLPLNPLQRWRSRRNLEQLRRYVDEMERLALDRRPETK